MHLRRTELYGRWFVAELFEAEESRYGHSFGGPVQHHGALLERTRSPLHLLYLINTQDPEIPITIPGIRYLPLYYCFDLRSRMRVGYRIDSESRIETFRLDLHQENSVGENPEYPYDRFPDQFEFRAVVAERSPFDPLNREHVREYIDVFGIESLSPQDQRALIRDLRNERDPSVGGISRATDEELQLTASGPSCQGHPASVCPNPECSNHTVPRSMQIIAIVPAYPFGDCVEHDTLDVFSPWGERCDLPCSDIEIVFEMCPVCSAIMATNQAIT
ncbi:MAG: hypothetical protein DWQ34_01260 [Planctomycetota bacterium]|nr:MAG: hypothetical protein DWQ29_13525 [Planctomycetota bacterium]REJ97705.1 MAG: hypothetical protein DWQ34_01260 [Planctomycetota bacterium]REK26681.1 MAG: hypothetical protein DWQ41_09020 [Planctomycetota bacterium]REK35660.1 MAG: hypothetical protein DWQ45_10935 [Planctomycetota bacterium]